MVTGESRPRVVLGVSGGIAAYKACELLRRFTESGHDVTVVPTAAALEFVGAPTWAALSGKPVTTDVWTDVHEVPHVRIGQQADLVVVAPGDRRPARQGGARPGRRPAHQHPAHRPLPGRVRAGDAHRDVGAPRHPGQRRHAARRAAPWCIEPAEGRLTGADTGKGRLPEPGARSSSSPPRCWPAATAGGADHPGPGRAARRGLRRRHPGVPRPGALPRQPLLGPAGLRAGPHRRGPRRRGDPGRRQRDACPTRPASRWSGSRPPPSSATRCSRRRATADAVVMAAAPADFRPDDASATPRSRSPTTAPRRTSELAQNPDILAGLAHERPNDRHRRRRVRRRDRRRHRLGDGARAGQAGPQGLRPAGGQRRRRRSGVRRPRTTRPSSSPPTGARSSVPLGSKAALAHVIWDRVLAARPRRRHAEARASVRWRRTSAREPMPHHQHQLRRSTA